MWRWITRGLILGGIAVLLLPVASAQNFAGFIERPADGETVYGMVLVSGWTLAEAQIASVDLYVDDQFQHSADISIPRIDVIQVYPDWDGVQSARPGFQTAFLASRFANGTHTVHILVTTDDGKQHEVGRRTVEIDNTINQPPFGGVDLPGATGVYDAHGSFPVSGWVTDTDGIDRVDVLVDGNVLQSAVYGDPRPDVGNHFPDFPAAVFSGFIAHVDTTRIQDGVHTLGVRATDRRGLSRLIANRTVQVFNTEANLRPFGNLDEPLRDAVLFGTGCGDDFSGEPPLISPQVPFDVDHHITPVLGWALDLGTRSDLGRVSYVELMVDGVVWYSTDNCAYEEEIDAFINCYGLPRMDVSRLYPTYPDAPRAGFMFALDVGTLMNAGVPPGHHDLKLRVGDREQTFADIPHTAGVPVWFQCADHDDDLPGFGYIDYPSAFEFLNGTVTFRGWALDDNNGVQNVEIWIDGVFAGFAIYGAPRTDVDAAYPTYPNSLNSGWRFTIDTTQLADSVHRLTVVMLDRQGNTITIGSRDFYVDNPN